MGRSRNILQHTPFFKVCSTWTWDCSSIGPFNENCGSFLHSLYECCGIDVNFHILRQNLMIVRHKVIVIWASLETLIACESFVIVPRGWKYNANLSWIRFVNFLVCIRQISNDVGQLFRTHMIVLIHALDHKASTPYCRILWDST